MAKWAEIVGRKEQVISVQLGPKSNPATNPKGAGRKEGGINQAARALGVPATKLKRARKIAALSPEAKAAGKDAPQSVLLAAAKEAEPAAQVAVIEAATVKDVRPDPATIVAGTMHDAPDEFLVALADGAGDVPELFEAVCLCPDLIAYQVMLLMLDHAKSFSTIWKRSVLPERIEDMSMQRVLTAEETDKYIFAYGAAILADKRPDNPEWLPDDF